MGEKSIFFKNNLGRISVDDKGRTEKECFNWKNLQPLWQYLNEEKQAQLDWTHPLLEERDLN